MSRTTAGHPLCSTDDVGEKLEALRLTLGEGPCVDAFTHSAAVLTPDPRTSELQERWPVFADAALAVGALVVFALLLQTGAIDPGVLGLDSQGPVRSGADEPVDAMAFAEFATLVLLGAWIGATGTSPTDTAAPGHGADLGGRRAEISQATGMLTVQLGVGIDEIIIRLRAYAYAQGRRLTVVAADVVARRLRFSPSRGRSGLTRTRDPLARSSERAMRRTPRPLPAELVSTKGVEDE
ncbi:ANTAR domain-containing protein [Streptomyces sp. TLI_146]|uniref:ANTAR domain-containing protein n=1 Tax=Streptomyces sp. TLI_146 TaxID=1938858 RepID=UPI000CB46EA9|nr:ANTAR domain-containing protein [Streptomyces sp. TLI_146]PKV90059.1 hypothetical protein BX283_7720 [Streptomyces sp. TLI_146]